MVVITPHEDDNHKSHQHAAGKLSDVVVAVVVDVAVG